VKEGEVLILAVGNLDPRKGHIVLLRALHELAGRGRDRAWRLAIAGGRGGPEQPGLEAFAAEHGMTDRVHILKYRRDIPDLLAAADILAMPSLWEGLPLAILEAMLAGTAVVASETSGIPEAIVSGEHGLLTPPGDVLALAGALETLMSDPAYRLRLADQARDRAMAEFTIGAMTGAYEELYRAAVS
jgi:glycosyltransferase involved in cell wall biosynthesis